MSGEPFDVAVVGARCAGASLATFLARSGVRVCLLDRARFPSDVPSTHAVQPNGVHVLRRLGVADQLLARTTPIDHALLALDDVRIRFDRITDRLGAPMLNLRRSVLDTALVEAAADAGADVRTRTPVTGLLERDGRVTGVRTPSGPVPARLVVGADGARSTVARLTGAPEYATTAPGRLFAWSYFEGVSDAEGARLGRFGDYGFLSSPTDGGLHIVAVAPSMSRRDEAVADPAAAFDAGLSGSPELSELVADARRVGPVRVVPRWHGYFRRSAGPGWALVGDAGHFKDPTLGQGISDALRQAEQLSRALEGAGDPDAATHAWWRRRDREAWPMYWFSQDAGAAGPVPALTREVYRMIEADPQLTDGLLRILDHRIAPSEVITTRVAVRAVVRAWRPGSRRAVLREALESLGDELRRLRRPAHPPYRAGVRPAPSPTAGQRV